MRILIIGKTEGTLTGPVGFTRLLARELANKHEVSLFRTSDDLSKKWDVVHVTDIMWAKYSELRLLTCPVIVEIHDYYWTQFFSYWSPDWPLRYLMQKVRRQRYLKVLSVSSAVITFCKYVYNLVPHPHKYYVPYTTDFSLFDVRRTQPVESREREVLFVGRNFFRKGIVPLLRALRLVRESYPNIRLTVVGKERLYSLVAAKLMSIGVTVDFVGQVDRKDLPGYYRRASLFVLPSFIESSPVTIMEAQASGVPIVAAHTGGIPEMLTHGVDGLLSPPGHHLMLAEHILACLENSSLARRLTTNGLNSVRDRFSTERTLAGVLEVYREALT